MQSSEATYNSPINYIQASKARLISTYSSLSICAIAGAIIVSLGILQMFGPLGSTGSILSLAGGGGLTLLSVAMMAGIALSRKKQVFSPEETGAPVEPSELHYDLNDIRDLKGELEAVNQFLTVHEPSAADDNGNTVLHITAGFGSYESVQKILTVNKDLSFINQTNNVDKTALHAAVHVIGDLETNVENRTKIVQLLIDNNADMEIQDKDGRTPLHFAVSSGLTEAVQILTEKGANVMAQDSMNKETPLHMACEKGYDAGVSILLNKDTDVVNAKTNSGWTSLHYAAYHGHTETVKILLNKGADRTAQEFSNRTPYELAKKPEIQELLKP